MAAASRGATGTCARSEVPDERRAYEVRCPGPYNTIASAGMCDRCGVEGPQHQRQLQEALASKNPRPLMAKAREAGRTEGYRQGLQAQCHSA